MFDNHHGDLLVKFGCILLNKSYMMIVAVLLLFTAAHAVMEGHSSPAGSDRLIRRYENFLIRYPIDQEQTAGLLVKLLKKWNRKIVQFYQTPVTETIDIYITSSPVEFHTLVDGGLPEWSGAAYAPALKAILVKSPSWSGSLFSFEKDIVHELSHLYFDQRFKTRELPLWYNEGLAEYLSGERIGMVEGLKLANALLLKKILYLREIDSLRTFGRAKAAMAYLQSLSAVLFVREILSDQQDWEEFQQMILLQGWEKALQHKLGMNEEEFEIYWYRYLEDHYRWMIILNMENIFWISLIFIGLLAYLTIRRQNRRKMQTWKETPEGPESFFD